MGKGTKKRKSVRKFKKHGGSRNRQNRLTQKKQKSHQRGGGPSTKQLQVALATTSVISFGFLFFIINLVKELNDTHNKRAADFTLDAEQNKILEEELERVEQIFKLFTREYKDKLLPEEFAAMLVNLNPNYNHLNDRDRAKKIKDIDQVGRLDPEMGVSLKSVKKKCTKMMRDGFYRSLPAPDCREIFMAPPALDYSKGGPHTTESFLKNAKAMDNMRDTSAHLPPWMNQSRERWKSLQGLTLSQLRNLAKEEGVDEKLVDLQIQTAKEDADRIKRPPRDMAVRGDGDGMPTAVVEKGEKGFGMNVVGDGTLVPPFNYKADLPPYCMIVKVNGIKVKGAAEIKMELDKVKVGESAKFTYIPGDLRSGRWVEAVGEEELRYNFIPGDDERSKEIPDITKLSEEELSEKLARKYIIDLILDLERRDAKSPGSEVVVKGTELVPGDKQEKITTVEPYHSTIVESY